MRPCLFGPYGYGYSTGLVRLRYAIVRGTSGVRAKGITWVERLDNPRRCSAHTRAGTRCGAWAIRGGNVCRVHGGGAPQTIAKAKQRLELAADRMAANLLSLAIYGESEAVKLGATNSALDRAGITAKAALEVSVEQPAPYEELLANMTGVASITRAESRARRGLPQDDPPALEVVDAEIVGPALNPPVDPAHSPADRRVDLPPPLLRGTALANAYRAASRSCVDGGSGDRDPPGTTDQTHDQTFAVRHKRPAPWGFTSLPAGVA